MNKISAHVIWNHFSFHFIPKKKMSQHLRNSGCTSLAHQCILCSEWVPSEWEPNSWLKKNHNNPPVIHNNPVHQLTYCGVKSCMFGRNKSIINTLKHYFHLKYKSSVHNIAFWNLTWIRRERCTDQGQFISENISKQTCLWLLRTRRMRSNGLVLLEEAILWIMDSYFLSRSRSLKIKRLDGFVSYKHAVFHFTIC